MNLRILRSYLSLLFVLGCITSFAQTTITTSTSFSNNATTGEVTFNFQNNNSTPVMITGLDGIVSVTGTTNVEAWYKTSAVNGAPGIISTSNGWTQFGSGTISGVANTSTANTQTFFNNLTLVIPAGATYGICVSGYTGTSTSALRYSSLSGVTVYQTQSGSCVVNNGYLVSYAGSARPVNVSPNSTPSAFIGAVTFTTPPACSGTPTPGNTLSSADSVCSGNAATFSLSTPPFATGISYQWQGSTDSLSWGNISGATASTYTATNVTATAYYRAKVSCGTNDAYSVPKKIKLSNYFGCYCIPVFTSGYGTYYSLNNVTLNTLSNPTTINPAYPYYTDFPVSTTTTSVIAGSSYTLGVTSGNGYAYKAAWIDWNHNGTFESTEAYVLPGYVSGLSTTTVTVPSTALSGLTKMRVRTSDQTLSATSPCTTYNYGETEDYTITVVVPTPCSGTPVPGATVSTLDSVCGSTSFTLSVPATIYYTGFTYQWQASTDNVTFGNLTTNATGATYTATQASTIYYRALVSCGAASAASTAKQVVSSLTLNCYCASAATSTYYENITNVTVGTINNSSTCTTTGTGNSIVGRYADYTNITPATLTQTQVVNFSVTLGTCTSNDNMGLAIFIDFNRDGDYLDNNEKVYASPSTIYGPTTYTGSFTVPSVASTGTTFMRVITVDGYPGSSITPCLSYSYGETEDYKLNINALTACSGTPNAGYAAISKDSVCSGTTDTLTVLGYSFNSGLTYQWQGSVDSVNWGNLSSTGATTNTCIITASTNAFYRCVVTCSGSSISANSVPVKVTIKSYLQCYCTPATSSTYYSYIGNVTFNTINYSSGVPSAAPYYTDYPASVATTSVYTQQAYPFTITINNGSGGYAGAAWIDWNHNGTFETTEYTNLVYSSATGLNTASITVPAAAVAGLTKVRVRSSYYSLSSTDACSTTTSYGETEDYTITTIVSQACSGTPTPGNVLASVDSACPAVNFTLSLSTPPVTLNNGYLWQSSPNNIAWANITGTSNSVTISQTAARYYRAKVWCGTDTATTPSKFIGMNTPYNCYCTPSFVYGPSGSYYITNVSLNTLNNNSTASSVSPYFTDYSPVVTYTTVYPSSTYTLSVTNSNYAYVRAWIDWNQNGTFETTESYLVSNSAQSGSVSVAVPSNALTGKTKMRIRLSASTLATTDPCTLISNYGESEDYTIYVGSTTACTGTPAPGNTISTADSVCTNVQFGLSISNPVLTSGVTYQWQSSPDNATWTNFFLANSINLYPLTQSSATYYRVAVTCGGVTAYSTAKYVKMTSVTNCYCTPVYTYGSTYYISNVSLGSLNSTSSYPTAAPYYTYYETPVPTLNNGATYTLTVTKPNYGTYVGAWIDWNKNGTFETTEFYDFGTNSNSGTYSVTIAVPVSVSGNVRMRVRSIYYSTTITSASACSTFDYGETEDYKLFIYAASVGITLKEITAKNTGANNLVTWSTANELKSDYFILERSADGANFSELTTVNANGKASDYSYTDRSPVSGINYYRLKTITADGKTAYSATVNATVTVTTTLVLEAFPNPVSNIVNVVVHGNMGDSRQVAVLDITGKVVKSVTVNDSNFTIDMSDIASGIYLLKYSDNQNTQTIRINKK